jgi:hypothetical protein
MKQTERIDFLPCPRFQTTSTQYRDISHAFAPITDIICSELCYSACMPSFLTSRQAAKLLGRTPKMAARRAKEAADQGDPNVIRIGQAWAAPEPWWVEHLKPKPRGRP